MKKLFLLLGMLLFLMAVETGTMAAKNVPGEKVVFQTDMTVAIAQDINVIMPIDLIQGYADYNDIGFVEMGNINDANLQSSIRQGENIDYYLEYDCLIWSFNKDILNPTTLNTDNKYQHWVCSSTNNDGTNKNISFIEKQKNREVLIIYSKITSSYENIYLNFERTRMLNNISIKYNLLCFS